LSLFRMRTISFILSSYFIKFYQIVKKILTFFTKLSKKILTFP
jgi:hypothetical protein